MGNCLNVVIPGPKPLSIEEEMKKRKEITRVLLLGAGESGKTTFMKQLTLSTTKFDDTYRSQYRNYALMNIVEGAYYVLVGGRSDPDLRITEPNARAAAQKLMSFALENSETAFDKNGNQVLKNPKAIENLPPDLVKALLILKKDPNFIKTLNKPNLQLQDGWIYLSEQINRYPEWGGKGWLPSDKDLLHLRVRTLGINSATFQTNNLILHVTDVGGQKSERSKWIRLFNNVHAVTYMQSMAEYDQVMFEDENVYRLQDSLDLWAKTVVVEEFEYSAIVVLFNKVDVLKRKFVVNRIPFPENLNIEDMKFPCYNPELNADDNVSLVFEWFIEVFKAKAPTRKFVAHMATAIDTNIMKKIVEAVILNIAEKTLINAGL